MPPRLHRFGRPVYQLLYDTRKIFASLVSTKTMCFQTESNFSSETYKAYILITLRIQVTLTPFRNPYWLGSFPHPFRNVGAMCALVLVGGDAYVIYVTTRHTFQSYKR